MATYTAVVERCAETGYFVGYVPGIPGAHTQASSLDELRVNLKEVLELVLEGGVVVPEVEFIGTQLVSVG